MLYAIVAVIALIADQALKYWTTANIELNEGVKAVIPGFIHLTNLHNSGAAFSFLQGARWLFVVLCVIFVAVVLWLLVKGIIGTPGARWAAVFIMTGAMGNCVDRVLSGYVVDMLEFEFIRFPVFNLADIFITVGAVVFCVCLLLEKPPAADGKAAGAAAPPEASREEPEPEAQAPMEQQGEYTHTPYAAPERAPRQPEPPPFDPADPFAEWEARDAEPSSAAPAASVPREMPVAPEAPARPAAAPDPAAESFDLEDILSEFKDWQ